MEDSWFVVVLYGQLKNDFSCLFMAVLGPRCRELQRVNLSLVAARGLWGAPSAAVVACGLGVGLGL